MVAGYSRPRTLFKHAAALDWPQEHAPMEIPVGLPQALFHV